MTLRVANLASSAFPATVTDLTVTNNLTLSAGTANGVLFLNGSKVVTSGSALTFDGSLQLTASVDGTNGIFRVSDTAASTRLQMYSDSTRSYFGVIENKPLVFLISNSEQMRLNSTGLGIGTSFPARKLDVNGGIRVASANPIEWGGATAYITGESSTNTLFFGTSGSEKMRLDSLGNLGVGTNSPNYRLVVSNAGGTGLEINPVSGANSGVDILAYSRSASAYRSLSIFSADVRFDRGGAESMRLDASGNLGLGVTPSAWFSGYRAIEIGTALGAYNFSTNSGFAFNAADDGSWKYRTTAFAGRYIFHTGSGYHAWLNAASGTAGTAISFTQAMTLDASGRLGIGTTNPQYALDVVGAIRLPNATAIYFNSNGGTPRTVLQYFSDNSTYLDASDGNIYFRSGTGTVQRLLIDTSGNVIVNTAAIATNATNGFLYVPTCAGTPTGTPTTYTGRSPIVVDSTNNKLYFYSGGAWRDAGP